MNPKLSTITINKKELNFGKGIYLGMLNNIIFTITKTVLI